MQLQKRYQHVSRTLNQLEGILDPSHAMHGYGDGDDDLGGRRYTINDTSPMQVRMCGCFIRTATSACTAQPLGHTYTFDENEFENTYLGLDSCTKACSVNDVMCPSFVQYNFANILAESIHILKSNNFESHQLCISVYSLRDVAV